MGRECTKEQELQWSRDGLGSDGRATEEEETLDTRGKKGRKELEEL